jgi:F-type H+-transporting ATPase subunit delta
VASKGSGLTALASSYALALYALADERRALDPVADDLRTIRALLAESEDLRRLVASPLLSRAAQGAAIGAVLERAGVGELVRNFVGLVARSRRLRALGAMIDAYLAELARRRGEITAEVTAARPLDDRQRQAVAEAVQRAVGGRVSLDVKVDPALIGGLVVKVASRMVDSSLRSKLQRLQLVMKGVG